MRDRLIEIISGFSYVQALGIPFTREDGHAQLADHLLAEGVIVPKLKVGDKLYALSVSRAKIYVLTITHFVVNENETQIWAVGTPYSSECAYICNDDDLNNNEWVYLTREEAEAALERSEQNGT